MPKNLEFALIILNKRNTTLAEKCKRITSMLNEWEWIASTNNQRTFDAIYRNNCDKQSVIGFRNLIKDNLGKEF